MTEKTRDVLGPLNPNKDNWVEGDPTTTRAMEIKTSTPKMSKEDLLRMIDFSPISVL